VTSSLGHPTFSQLLALKDIKGLVTLENVFLSRQCCQLEFFNTRLGKFGIFKSGWHWKNVFGFFSIWHYFLVPTANCLHLANSKNITWFDAFLKEFS
jgi:hypothetical protein